MPLSPRRPGVFSSPDSNRSPPMSHAAVEHRRELDQRSGEDVGDDAVRAAASRRGPGPDVELEATPLRSALSRLASQRLRIDVDADRVRGAELQGGDARGCRSRSRNRSRVRPARSSAVERLAGTARSSGACRCRRRVPDRAARPRHRGSRGRVRGASGRPTGARPKRIDFQSASQTRSQRAVCDGRAPAPSRRCAAPSAAASSAEACRQRRCDRIEQRAHQRVAPQPHLAGLGFEHRLVAAVHEGDRAGADLEQRRLDRVAGRGRKRKFDFVERHRSRGRVCELTSAPGAAPDSGCRCRPGGTPSG